MEHTTSIRAAPHSINNKQQSSTTTTTITSVMARYEQNNGSSGPPSKRGRLEGRDGSSGGGGGIRSHARTGTWLPMEVEEELARCDPDNRPNHVLLFTILNAQYTIDVSIMYKVCSPVGKVQRIVVFCKGKVVHSMVEFDGVETASQAKRQLHGCDIYSGCCTLKVSYSILFIFNVLVGTGTGTYFEEKKMEINSKWGS